MEPVELPSPPTGLRRRLWRLPIRLYHMKLGPLLGRRIMLLVHTGRMSGLRRQAVVEVVEHDGHSYVAAAGFGTRADWYRNVQDDPHVTLQIGGKVVQATAIPVGTDEGADIMARYASRHPSTARRLSRFMGFAVNGSTDDYREVGRRVPFVRFTLLT